MVRRSKRHNKLGGGIWDSISRGTQSAWTSTKEAVKKTTSELTGTPAPAPLMTAPMSMGGRRRRRSGLKGGTCHANTSHTNLASTAAPYTVTTASPQVIVGGKTRKRRSLYRKSNKGRSCRHKHRHTKRCKK